jgi:sec-independent protein translocase protein TatB
MFDIGWGELLLIGVVALIAIGPKELPGALRTLGQWMGKIRRMGSEFQSQFQEAIREAEMADLKKDVDEMVGQATRTFDTPFDSVAEAGNSLAEVASSLEKAGTVTPAAEPAMTGPQPPPVLPEPAPPVPEPEVAAHVPDAPKPSGEGPRG